MADLEMQFTRAMFDVYRRAKSEARYNATIFLQMITTMAAGDGKDPHQCSQAFRRVHRPISAK